ncbi:MAG TPA: EAL domain-containing protein [Allocoleopsis sp.]
MSQKILVIEDTESLREDILEIIECLHFEAIGAENGMIGLQLAEEHLPDLIICDIMMPKLDGYGVFKSLRTNQKTARIPFIFLTAKADKKDIRQGMNLGADDYLTKPFSIDDLQEAIQARLEKKAEIEEHLNQRSLCDTLTNLPNRIFFNQELQTAIVNAEGKKQLLAILLINIDKFHLININQGQAMGDLLLQKVADRLKDCFAENNDILLGRFGGDEFSLILLDIKNQQYPAEIAEKLLHELTEVYMINEQELRINVSMGISVYPQDSKEQDLLLNHAQTALKFVKQQGGANYRFYLPEMDQELAEINEIAKDLQIAIEQKQLFLHYQPQVHLLTGKIVGAEALIRWLHPEKGMISPAKFIPIAEEIGLIVPIGDLVMRLACKQAKFWGKYGNLRIAINLSALQFKQHDLIDKIIEILQENDLEPSKLELEITETSAMENVTLTAEKLHQLRAKGFHLSIDDFGTGHCSLNYLSTFPVHTLKVDRSFINQINTGNERDSAITTMIINMAKTLKLDVVAEGVETLEQVEFLKKSHCDIMQGYLFSPPVAAEKFEQLLIAQLNQ